MTPELNKIYNMDCLEGMRQILDKSIDMILCDLPYGTTSCAWDTIIPFKSLWEQYERIIKENAAIVLTSSQPFTTDLINSNRKLFKYELIWCKDRPSDFGNSNRKPLRYHENICVFYTKTPKYNKQYEDRKGSGNDRMKYPVNYKQGSDHKFGMKSGVFNYSDTKKIMGSVIDISIELRGSINHPTVKPVALFKHLIETYTDNGDLVLDNCIGSGTTAVACIRTGRQFIGFEKDKGYFDAAQIRINQEVEQKKIC